MHFELETAKPLFANFNKQEKAPMKLIWKLSIPQICIVVCLGLVSYVVIHSSFTGMRENYVRDIVENRFKRIYVDIETNAQAAADLSAIFAQIPAVIDAYETAFRGDINDAYSPDAQAAREKLRIDLAPMLNSYKDSAGSAMQLHYHLPNGRSLVRLWRAKQTRVKGEWTDLSDDLTSFRPTVLEVNRTGKPVKGIELGSGGFAVRGVVPVVAPGGRQVGSVEMLHDFDAILAAAAEEGQNEMILYINAELLPIATALQDPEKNPRVGDFVRVTKPKDAAMVAAVTPALLTAGKNGTVFEDHGNISLATLPVKDYKGQQVGVILCSIKTDSLAALARAADVTLIAMLCAMALLPFTALMLRLRALVTGPIKAISGKIQDITEDRADLRAKIDSRQNDEIGGLARSFDALTTKLTSMLDEMDGYVNMLNTVPDPIFMVDDNYYMLMANKATLDFLGVDEEEMRACKCFDVFKSNVCQSEDCPIAMAKKSGRPIEADIIEINRENGCIFIKPCADVIMDSAGNKTGYVEVARVVTQLVESERDINSKLERIRSVNDATREAAAQLGNEAVTLGDQFAEVQKALGRQHDRLHETVAAMEQMNVTVQEVAKGATEAADLSQAARDQAQRGAEIVEKSMRAITRVSEHAAEMKKAMHGLGEQAEGIGAVLGVISDIADQTNLLALNAAIEAARAGDAGRGFAVVADEVRKLAEKTMQATDEVEKAISSIQNGAHDSVRMADETVGLVGEASSLALESGEALKSIVDLISYSADKVHSIAASAEEQSATSEQINRAVDEVAGMTTDVEERMNASSVSVNELSGLAARLDGLSQQG